MSPQEAMTYLNKPVSVNSPKITGVMTFTAYVFRIKNNKKLYQAEVQQIKPPHEVYVVALDDISPV